MSEDYLPLCLSDMILNFLFSEYVNNKLSTKYVRSDSHDKSADIICLGTGVAIC